MGKSYSLKTTLRPSLRAISRTVLGLRLGLAVQLPERDYEELLQRLESDELFQEMSLPGPGRAPVISRKPWAIWQPPAFLFSEAKVPEESPLNWGLIEENDKTIGLIRKIGRSSFERFFLYEQEKLPAQDIARACGLSMVETASILRFVKNFLMRSPSFEGPITRDSSPTVNVVARIVKNSDQTLTLGVFSARYARGLYRINQEALETLRHGLPEAKRTALSRLLAQIEMANKKQSALEALGRGLISSQRNFLLTGNAGELKPMTQRRLCRETGVHPSVCSRLLNNRAAQMPWGEVLALRELTPSRGRLMRRKILDLAMKEKEITAREIRRRLKACAFPAVSIRLVNYYRCQGAGHV